MRHVAWCGVAWRGVAWRGAAWCGVALLCLLDGVVRQRVGIKDVLHLIVEHSVSTETFCESDIGCPAGARYDLTRA